MPIYNEVCVRAHKDGERKIKEDEIVRKVSIAERDAAIMNTLHDPNDDHSWAFQYVKVEAEPKEPTRADLFKLAAERGLTPAKNIKTEDLKALIEEK